MNPISDKIPFVQNNILQFLSSQTNSSRPKFKKPALKPAPIKEVEKFTIWYSNNSQLFELCVLFEHFMISVDATRSPREFRIGVLVPNRGTPCPRQGRHLLVTRIFMMYMKAVMIINWMTSTGSEDDLGSRTEAAASNLHLLQYLFCLFD